MTLLPPYSEGLLDSNTWGSNMIANAQATTKFEFNDDFTATFEVGQLSSAANAYSYNYLESPTLPPAQVFDTGLPGNAIPTNGVTVAPMPTAGAAVSGPNLAANLQRVADASDGGANALQLHTSSLTTPTGSPRAVAMAGSGYPSPSFQLSPTPGLTMCPTVDSTPGPRSHSRSTSPSPFSHGTDGSASATSNSATKTKAEKSTPVMPLRMLGGGGRKNSAVANGTFKPKKPHLCPFEMCERHTRTFRSNADLQRHIRSHQGEKPHICPAAGCERSYGQQNKMVKHVEAIHPHLLALVENGRSRRRKTAVQRNADANVRRASFNGASNPSSLLANKAMGPSLMYHSYPSTPVQSPPAATHSAPTSVGSLGPYQMSPLGGSSLSHSNYARPSPYPPRSGSMLHQMTRTDSAGASVPPTANLGMSQFVNMGQYNGNASWWTPPQQQ